MLPTALQPAANILVQLSVSLTFRVHRFHRDAHPEPVRGDGGGGGHPVLHSALDRDTTGQQTKLANKGKNAVQNNIEISELVRLGRLRPERYRYIGCIQRHKTAPGGSQQAENL